MHPVAVLNFISFLFFAVFGLFSLFSGYDTIATAFGFFGPPAISAFLVCVYLKSNPRIALIGAAISFLYGCYLVYRGAGISSAGSGFALYFWAMGIIAAGAVVTRNRPE